jgi:flagellar assembly protein FliH
MTKSAAPDKKEKFFFNVNIFDEPDLSVTPPPTFSETELATTAEKSFNDGKRAGLKESEESRNAFIAKLLDKITRDTALLFAAEAARERAYEQEAVKLCLAALQKIFPLYAQKCGFEELKSTVESILRKQEGQKHIIVQIAPDAVEGIQAHLAQLKSKGLDTQITVQGDELMAVGACRLSWSDGGAVRNPEETARHIENALRDLLAGTATKGHDGL